MDTDPNVAILHQPAYREGSKEKMRQVIVTIMIVVGMIAGLGGIFAIYVLDTVVDGDDFATRTADALSDPVVGN